ncbi:TNF receptor-associated factor 6 [Panulirus ornatus]|uniref:TNF receptor-associated factor 6 n=1 Tax=Panulirus ornatus TaxID=150431 RepID=UPI003A8409FA
MRGVLACVVAVCAVACCTAQHSPPEDLQSMLNHLVQNSGSDVQSLSYCRISTRDLIATAQSTASRVLQGVCNPRELNERFTTLETQVVDQFNVLKTMVLNIEDQLRTQDKQIKKLYGRLRQDLRALRAGASEGATPYDSADYLPEGDAEEEYDYGIENEEQSPRQTEIFRYNSTMHQEDGVRVFTYYWQVNDITYKMNNWGWRRSLRSESFYIFQGGYRMYMRIYPNQRGENVYIHVGLTQGDYDDNLDWPFRQKHRINILDHGFPAEDLTSRVWDPTQLCSGWHWRRPSSGDNYECVGLGFSKETLHSRRYINNDAIVVKLTVILTPS